MNRMGCFVAGIVTGLVVLQAGHALYLRSGDYVWAVVYTAVFGALVAGFADMIAENWV